MIKKNTLAEQILQFYQKLSQEVLDVPTGYKVVNPYNGAQKNNVEKVTTAFYEKYYNDAGTRRLILGSSPARRGSSVTGVPFEDGRHLQSETGIYIDKFYISQSSSGFLYDVINEYGGCKKFYTDFYMSFVCPLGLVRINSRGNEVNCNYYENKKLREAVHSFVISALQSQMKFRIDTSVCYCIGSGENYNFLAKINKEYNFFNTIIPLEHPRFIMQYNSKNRDIFLEKYINALRDYN